MKSRPILFSGPMVRAILDGRKTQTRRVVKGSPVYITPFIGSDNQPMHEFGLHYTHERVINKHVRCPYGQPGDRLWVRETFWVEHDCDGDDYRSWDCGIDLKDSDWARVQYPATPENSERPDEPGTWWEAPPDGWDGTSDYTGNGTMTWLPWGIVGAGPAFFSKRPAIHMPRWASRLTLEVVSVRVERLHAITEADARAEGVSADDISRVGIPCYSALQNFERLWCSIYGAESWDANPWAWVVEFKRL